PRSAPARRLVKTPCAADLTSEAAAGLRDYKTRLQELTQRLFRATPVYHLVEESGPDHAKRFVAQLSIAGQPYGRGVGHSKKTAEQAAAMEALEMLARMPPVERDG